MSIFFGGGGGGGGIFLCLALAFYVPKYMATVFQVLHVQLPEEGSHVPNVIFLTKIRIVHTSPSGILVNVAAD